MLYSMTRVVSQFMADLRCSDERFMRERVAMPLPDPGMDYAFAAALMAPQRALEMVAHNFELTMLKSDLEIAKQDTHAARIDATHWRLRAEYAERRLAQLTKQV